MGPYRPLSQDFLDGFKSVIASNLPLPSPRYPSLALAMDSGAMDEGSAFFKARFGNRLAMDIMKRKGETKMATNRFDRRRSAVDRGRRDYNGRRAFDDEDDPQELAAQLVAFLSERLDPADFEKVEDALDRWSRAASTAEDEPPDFPGKPIPGGGQVPLSCDPRDRQDAGDRRDRRFASHQAQDARSMALDAASRIETDTSSGLAYLNGNPVHGAYAGRTYSYGKLLR